MSAPRAARTPAWSAAWSNPAANALSWPTRRAGSRAASFHTAASAPHSMSNTVVLYGPQREAMAKALAAGHI